jgi:hypothetical protein
MIFATIDTVSRRAFLHCAAGAMLPMVVARAEGQNRDARLSAPLRQLKFAKEIRDAYLLSLSPDGSKMCVYFTRHPNTTFIFRRGERGRIDAGNPKEENLSVIKLGSWDIVYSDRLSMGPGGQAEFFAGANVLYVENLLFVPPDGLKYQRMTVDLSDGHQEQRLQTRDPGEPGIDYHAVDRRLLIGTETGTPPARHAALIRATLPNYEEVERVSFAVPVGAEPEGFETGIVISDDRETLAYAFGHTLVCRRTNDLAVLWTQPIERDLWGTRRLAVSANGSRVAVAVIDTDWGIGKNGSMLACTTVQMVGR